MEIETFPKLYGSLNNFARLMRGVARAGAESLIKNGIIDRLTQLYTEEVDENIVSFSSTIGANGGNVSNAQLTLNIATNNTDARVLITSGKFTYRVNKEELALLNPEVLRSTGFQPCTWSYNVAHDKDDDLRHSEIANAISDAANEVWNKICEHYSELRFSKLDPDAWIEFRTFPDPTEVPNSIGVIAHYDITFKLEFGIIYTHIDTPSAMDRIAEVLKAQFMPTVQDRVSEMFSSQNTNAFAKTAKMISDALKDINAQQYREYIVRSLYDSAITDVKIALVSNAILEDDSPTSFLPYKTEGTVLTVSAQVTLTGVNGVLSDETKRDLAIAARKRYATIVRLYDDTVPKELRDLGMTLMGNIDKDLSREIEGFNNWGEISIISASLALKDVEPNGILVMVSFEYINPVNRIGTKVLRWSHDFISHKHTCSTMPVAFDNENLEKNTSEFAFKDTSTLRVRYLKKLDE